MRTQTQVHLGSPEQDAMTRVTESESDLPGSVEGGAESLQRQDHSTRTDWILVMSFCVILVCMYYLDSDNATECKYTVKI